VATTVFKKLDVRPAGLTGRRRLFVLDGKAIKSGLGLLHTAESGNVVVLAPFLYL
jgi:hypothetical protein